MTRRAEDRLISRLVDRFPRANEIDSLLVFRVPIEKRPRSNRREPLINYKQVCTKYYLITFHNRKIGNAMHRLNDRFVLSRVQFLSSFLPSYPNPLDGSLITLTIPGHDQRGRRTSGRRWTRTSEQFEWIQTNISRERERNNNRAGF